MRQLTPTQIAVLTWLAGGWWASSTDGRTVAINGEKVGNLATLMALEKQGLSAKIPPYAQWKITPAGREGYEATIRRVGISRLASLARKRQ